MAPKKKKDPEPEVIELEQSDEEQEAKPAKKPRGPRKKKEKKEEEVEEAEDDAMEVDDQPLQLDDAGEVDEEIDIDTSIGYNFTETREPPAELLMPLLQYQKQFLAWAVKQEQGSVKGGILADEMGMGKTIQAISLIVSHRNDDLLSTFDSSGIAAAATAARAIRDAAAAATSAARPRIALGGGPNGRALRSSETLDDQKKPAPAPAPAPKAPSRSKPSTAPPTTSLPPPASAAANVAASAASTIASSSMTPAICPHVKPVKGNKPWLASLCQECLRIQDPSALVTAVGGKVKASTGPSSEATRPYSKTTLVICPVVAIIQWRDEILKFTAPGSLVVMIHHGSKRKQGDVGIEELESADVVLTTYSTIESEHRRFMQPPKICCSYCSKKFLPEKLKVHLRFFCGPNAVKSEALSKQQKKRKPGNKDDEDDEDDPEDEDEEEEAAAGPSSRGKKSKFSKGESGSKASSTSKASSSSKGKGKSKVSIDEEDEDGEEQEDPKKASLKKNRDAFKKWWFKGEGEGDDEWGKKAEAEAEAMIKAASDAQKREEEGPSSVLHKVKWRRIILDEAHNIKDRRSSTAKAVFSLDSKYKWALSGTPLQNRVTELYSLIRFLRLFPYAYYFCGKKGCPDCSSLDYQFVGGVRICPCCGHSAMTHFCWWNRFVGNPIIAHGYQGKGRSAMLLLKNQILPKILLRRTKVQCADSLALPPRTLILRKDQFDKNEADFYEALYTQSQASFGSYVESGTLLNNYAHIFDLLIRLRQAVCHPYLVVYSATAAAGGRPALVNARPASAANREAEEAGALAGSATKSDASGSESACQLCHDELEDEIKSSCGHSFCRLCLMEYVESAASDAQARCPIASCKQLLTFDLSRADDDATPVKPAKKKAQSHKKSSIINRIKVDSFTSSTKIEALREEISRMIERDPGAKCLVFSQFTSMLQLIAFRLESVDIKLVKLEGSMTLAQRDAAINTFTNDADTRVFLMSLKAGGVALNLTVASHVFLIDPWWNPAVESQAMDRIHRLGQYKPITVVRFIIAGTIEERILKLQEKKALVFEGTVGRDLAALARLTEDDLKFLFH